MPGFELATFRSRIRRSNQRAIPAPTCTAPGTGLVSIEFVTHVSSFFKLRPEMTHVVDSTLRSGIVCWSKHGLVIERLRVRIPAGVAGEFSSPKLTLCANPYSVSVPPPLEPKLHVKDPGHSSKSADGRLHLNTQTHLTQRSRDGLTMPLSRHCAGTYPETSSHATCQGTLDHSRLSSLSHCGLILA